MANYLIVAASSGMGQALTDMLKEKGHTVYTTARDSETITPDATLDATDFEAVEAVFTKAQDSMGSIDGVVNCAGSLLIKPAHTVSQEDFEATVSASLTTAFAVVRAAGKVVKSDASVVLISSGAAMSGHANHEAIAAAKAGIIGLTQSAAASYASANLRFNAVAPGLTDTPLTQSITQNETSLKVSAAMHALGRVGSPQDIARAIAFFLDPENSWITGQILGVDGGLSTVQPKLKV